MGRTLPTTLPCRPALWNDGAFPQHCTSMLTMERCQRHFTLNNVRIQDKSKEMLTVPRRATKEGWAQTLGEGLLPTHKNVSKERCLPSPGLGAYILDH